MYGNFNPNTAAWPFTPEKYGDDWYVVDNRNVLDPVLWSDPVTFEDAKRIAAERNSNHFRGA